MTDFFSLVTLWRFFLYGLVSLMELGMGYATMKYLQDRRKYSRFWAFFFQSIMVGAVAFTIRDLWVFS